MAKRDKKRSRRIPPAKKLQAHLPTKGDHHDLLEIYNAVNTWYFDGTVKAKISWGRRPHFPPHYHKGTIKMGCCHVKDRFIVINRSLDRSCIPRFIVEYTIFHEILHILFPPKQKNGRREFHHATFKAAEREFARYDEAEQWEKDNTYILHFF